MYFVAKHLKTKHKSPYMKFGLDVVGVQLALVVLSSLSWP